MKYQKKVISDLNLCYSLAELTYKGKHCFLVAAEKHDPCYLFDEAGTKIAEPWAGPGGVMTMQQVPEHDGQFLATHESTLQMIQKMQGLSYVHRTRKENGM